MQTKVHIFAWSLTIRRLRCLPTIAITTHIIHVKKVFSMLAAIFHQRKNEEENQTSKRPQTKCRELRLRLEIQRLFFTLKKCLFREHIRNRHLDSLASFLLLIYSDKNKTFLFLLFSLLSFCNTFSAPLSQYSGPTFFSSFIGFVGIYTAIAFFTLFIRSFLCRNHFNPSSFSTAFPFCKCKPHTHTPHCGLYKKKKAVISTSSPSSLSTEHTIKFIATAVPATDIAFVNSFVVFASGELGTIFRSFRCSFNEYLFRILRYSVYFSTQYCSLFEFQFVDSIQIFPFLVGRFHLLRDVVLQSVCNLCTHTHTHTMWFILFFFIHFSSPMNIIYLTIANFPFFNGNGKIQKQIEFNAIDEIKGTKMPPSQSFCRCALNGVRIDHIRLKKSPFGNYV